MKLPMKRRATLSKGTARKAFKQGASKTHAKNVGPRPMRGGYRL